MSGDTLDFLQGNRETLTGTLHDPAATTGHVLTVQADKSIAAAPGGGSMSIPVPAADQTNEVVDDTTYDNTYLGTGKLSVLVLPLGGDIAAAIAVQGDAFPRVVLYEGGMYVADGTVDPLLSGIGAEFGPGGLSLPDPAANVSTYTVVVQSVGTSASQKIISGAVDPTAGGGITAAMGSLYMRENGGAGGTGEVWAKTGAANTAWTKLTP